jgi:hypothetical protein
VGVDQRGPGSYAAGTTRHDADVVILGMGAAGEDLDVEGTLSQTLRCVV